MRVHPLDHLIIAYPSEKGGYNLFTIHITFARIIAYPSEKGGYNIWMLVMELN